MEIVICNGKGGTGKTTVSMLLTMALHSTGRTVAVRDQDPQRTATRWIASSCPEIPLATPDTDKTALIVTDTPPRLDSSELAASLARCQAVVVVTSPSPADLFEGRPTAQVIAQAGATNRARVLFNRVDRRKTLSKNLDQTAKQIGFPAFRTVLEDRTGYEYLSLNGWASLPPKLRNDVFALALEILALVA